MTAPPTKLSQALAREVGNTPDYRFYFLSELLRRPVDAGPGAGRFGRIKDLVVKIATPYPAVVGLLIDHGWGRPHEFLPWEHVGRLSPESLEIALPEDHPPFRPYVDQPGWILLNDHLMGQTILDIDGRRTEVVHDIHLLESKGRMLLVHVDVSRRAALRRLGLGRFHFVEERLISWRTFRPLTVEGSSSDTVLLTATKRQTKYLPGDDLAAALDELKRPERPATNAAPDGYSVSTDFIAVPGSTAAGELLQILRRSPHRPDAVAAIFVVKPDQTLVGAVDLCAAVLAPEASPVEDLITQPVPTAPVDAPRSLVEEHFNRAPCRTVAIVDAQNRLVGVVIRSDFIG